MMECRQHWCDDSAEMSRPAVSTLVLDSVFTIIMLLSAALNEWFGAPYHSYCNCIFFPEGIQPSLVHVLLLRSGLDG